MSFSAKSCSSIELIVKYEVETLLAGVNVTFILSGSLAIVWWVLATSSLKCKV